MGKRVKQLLQAAVAPVLTVGCTWLVADVLQVGNDLEKAVGAALAGVLLFVAIELTDELPKRSWRWRRRIDPRAAFEGWWLQIHDRIDRVAVYSCLYVTDGDSYRVEGHAFNAAGEMLAHWRSTQVFFSTGALSASYLWDGTSYESDPPITREGTTAWSVQRSSGQRVLPTSGHGKVLHLNQDRTLVFRVQRLTPERVRALLGRAIDLDALVDHELQRELAVSYFRSTRSAAPSASHP